MIEITVRYDDGSKTVYLIPEEYMVGGLPLDLANLLFHCKKSMKVYNSEGIVIID